MLKIFIPFRQTGKPRVRLASFFGNLALMVSRRPGARSRVRSINFYFAVSSFEPPRSVCCRKTWSTNASIAVLNCLGRCKGAKWLTLSRRMKDALGMVWARYSACARLINSSLSRGAILTGTLMFARSCAGVIRLRPLHQADIFHKVLELLRCSVEAACSPQRGARNNGSVLEWFQKV